MAIFMKGFWAVSNAGVELGVVRAVTAAEAVQRGSRKYRVEVTVRETMPTVYVASK